MGGPDSRAVYVVLSEGVRFRGTYQLSQSSHVIFGRAGQRLGTLAGSQPSRFSSENRLMSGVGAIA